MTTYSTFTLDEMTRIVIGAESEPQVRRGASFLALQIQARYELDLAIVEDAELRPGDIYFGLVEPGASDEDFAPRFSEEFVVSRDPGYPNNLRALAGNRSVALALAGTIARGLKPLGNGTRIEGLPIRERPAYPVRGHTPANHLQNTTHDKWTWDHWEEYLTEMAAWGNNIAILYPLHPERWPGVAPFDEPPWFDSADRQTEYERQIDIQMRLPQLCEELGMRYGVWLTVNDVFPAEVAREPDLTRFGDAYVCPSNPKARARIRLIRDKLFAALPRMDVLFLPSQDGGGCPGCSDCGSWGPKFIELVNEQIQQARKYHPDCMAILSLQGLDQAEAHHVLTWIDQERPTWLEGLAVGPFSELLTFGRPEAPGNYLSLEEYPRGGTLSGVPARLRAALPADYRLYLYPDITHVFRAQYPIIGMDPAVQYVWSREDGPMPRPLELASIHKSTSHVSDGSFPYSEGDADDVNKYIWSALDWDPSRAPKDIATDYAAWFFGADVAESAAEIILGTEQILGSPIYGNHTVGFVYDQLNAIEREREDLLDNWRWLLLRIGVLMLRHIQEVVHRDHEIAAVIQYRLPHSSDPTPHLTRVLSFVTTQFEALDGLTRDIIWTRDRLFEEHRLAIRGVARLQNSYAGLDKLVEQWEQVLAEILNGNLNEYPSRYKAILDPLREFQHRARLSTQGIGLASQLKEYPWQEGELVWHWTASE